MGTPIRDALGKVYTTADSLRLATDERDAAVCDALLAGAPLRAIAREAGISHHGAQLIAARGGLVATGPRVTPTWTRP
jgi:hypothetical protein